MIYIKRNENNKVVLKMSDKRIDCDSCFILKIYQTVANTESRNIYMILDDISLNPSFNLYNIKHNHNAPKKEVYINEDVYLESGQYVYEVLEVDCSIYNDSDILDYVSSGYILDLYFDDSTIDDYLIGNGTVEKDILFVELERVANTNDNKDVYY